ncbi:MAG: hypothetical protein LBI39_03155 [Puniceicoccales bacterium]|nr:hypothetical protein [Puniceicoccales bacterium]
MDSLFSQKQIYTQSHDQKELIGQCTEKFYKLVAKELMPEGANFDRTADRHKDFCVRARLLFRNFFQTKQDDDIKVYRGLAFAWLSALSQTKFSDSYYWGGCDETFLNGI